MDPVADWSGLITQRPSGSPQRIQITAPPKEAVPTHGHEGRHGRVGEKRLSGHAIAEAIKRAAERAGHDRTSVSGHSLRSGLATSAAKAGKSERAIMAQTGHRSAAMVRRYIRDADLFNENAAAGLL